MINNELLTNNRIIIISTLLISLLLFSCPISADIFPPEDEAFYGGTRVLSFQQEMVNAVNEVRISGYRGSDGTFYPPVVPLVWNTRLENAAYRHSYDMHENSFISHTGSDGSSPWQRIREAGYEYVAASENVAMGYTTIDWVMEGWLGSPGHCRNIMSKDVTRMGAARVGNSWTQVFSRPYNESSNDPDDISFDKKEEKGDEKELGDALITPTSFSYYLGSKEDALIHLNYNERNLIGISDGSYYLDSASDYKVEGNSITIKNSYLDRKGVGEFTLIFRMNGGINPTLAVTIDAFTVTFRDWDYSILKRDKVVYGESALPPEMPKREGYAFIEWDDDISLITSDLNVSAVYGVNTYDIYYFLHGNGYIDGIDFQMVNHGLSAAGVKAVANEGYYFSGWSDGILSESRVDSDIRKDLSLTAVFLPYDYFHPVSEYEAALREVTNLFDDEGKLLPEVEEDEFNSVSFSVILLANGEEKDYLLSILSSGREEIDERLDIVFPLGDVGGTGEITVSDAILVLRHIVGLIVLDESQLERAKILRGEELLLGDAIMILRYIVGLVESLNAS